MQEKTDSHKTYERLQEQLRLVLPSLSQTEQKILTMRFGLDTGYSCTLEEVCLCFGMTQLQIRTVEAKALLRLKKMGVSPFTGIENTETENQTKKLLGRKKNMEVIGILKSLPTQEQEIVRAYYGLVDDICVDKNELCKRFMINLNYLDKIVKKVKRRLDHKPDLFSTIQV